MVLWRISNHADLLGTGGMLASARWHTAGRPVVYLAESPAGALLEVLVHLELDEVHLPPHYQLLKVETEDEPASDRIDPATLSPLWSENESETRALGDAWLRAGVTSLLWVPSAIVPETSNWLLNPRHADGGHLRVVSVRKLPFDSRLA